MAGLLSFNIEKDLEALDELSFKMLNYMDNNFLSSKKWIISLMHY